MCDDVVVVVHHDAEGLAEDEGSPDEHVPEPRPLHLLPNNQLAEERERELGHHPQKGPGLETDAQKTRGSQ